MQVSLNETEYVQLVFPNELCCLKELVGSLAISVYKAPDTVPDPKAAASLASYVAIKHFDGFVEVAGGCAHPQHQGVNGRGGYRALDFVAGRTVEADLI